MENKFTSVFSSRYGSNRMREIFSQSTKFTIWRDLWYILASTQRDLGVPIPEHAINELNKARHITDVEMRVASYYEEQTHHDVYAHILTLGEVCPTAKPFIHLGATSCYITDNTDIIQIRLALVHVYELLNTAIFEMAKYGKAYADIPTVGYTHYQPAQLTTVGKRFAMWLDGFKMDEDSLVDIEDNLVILGCKGAVGTYSGMLPILGSYDKCIQLDHNIARELKFKGCVKISGQTYNRKQDSKIMSILSGIAQSAYKFAQDIRLLAHDGEIYETRGEKQVGSSAMPYKNNPITCERICGLSRYVITMTQNFDHTAATQWLERSLDDSANRRATIAEIFLAISEILTLVKSVLDNLTIDTDIIDKHVQDHLPHVVAEQVIADGVLAGGDRQDIHEQLRTGNLDTTTNYEIGDPKQYIGCAPEQTRQYCRHILGGR